MDRGRMIDHVQNVNTYMFDSFRKNGKTSIRTLNPPGGQSSIQLGWTYYGDSDYQYEPPQRVCGKKRFDNNQMCRSFEPRGQPMNTFYKEAQKRKGAPSPYDKTEQTTQLYFYDKYEPKCQKMTFGTHLTVYE